MKAPMTTQIKWISADKLPGSDTTVIIHCPEADEPIWLGYHDGETWRTVEGAELKDEEVKHWTDLPEPPDA